MCSIPEFIGKSQLQKVSKYILTPMITQDMFLRCTVVMHVPVLS